MQVQHSKSENERMLGEENRNSQLDSGHICMQTVLISHTEVTLFHPVTQFACIIWWARYFL